MVEREVEGVEVAPATQRVDVAELAIDDQRHALLGDAAVRAQRGIEPREVMARRRRADHGRALGDDDEVADAIGRQLEEGRGLGPRADRFDSGQDANAQSA